MDRNRAGQIQGGVIVMGVGIVFLLSNLDYLPPIHRIWPLFPIIVGIALILGGIFGRSRRAPGGGAPPGSS
jgi:hypothetical protein